jgi:pimeloyl-ACP methyl ester carboxylesterase
MPVANIRGVAVNYEVLGERGAWVALQPGGRRGLEGVKPLGEKIAEAGFRVLVYDRRNCGASSVSFDGGEAENEIWAADLNALLAEIDAAPAYIGGSSSGCRLALLMALRHPEAVRGLLLWRVTGGAYAAERLARNYYTQYIEMAETGGMEAVCASEHWSAVIAANPANRARLLALDPARFIAIMRAWRTSFEAGAEHPVIGLSPAELRSLTMPTCIAPGKDPVHPPPAGFACHRLMPNAEFHEVVTEMRATLDEAFADWDAKEGLLAATFIDFLRRQGR